MRKWMGLVAGVAVIIILVVALLSIGRGVLALMNAAGSSGEADPMFAEPAETVTRPPELDAEDPYAEDAEDASDGWFYDVLTPVDKTASELASEEPRP